jgi:N-acetylglucosaminyldiphosphoundecaprenol N-acetyl-beta-D-mannosaminyltransferase
VLRELGHLFEQAPNDVNIEQKDKRVQIGGASVDAVTFAEAVLAIEQHILSKAAPAYAVTPNAQHIVLLNSNSQLRATYDEAKFVFADGMSLVLAARLLGRWLPERVPGVDLFQALCASSSNLGLRVFLLGGRPGAAELTARLLETRHPGINITGTYCPPAGFENDAVENHRIGELVSSSNSDLLFVGLGAPKQEYWIQKHYRSLNVRMCMGIGGSFDMVAGITPRAPKWLQNLALEWLFRLLAEPRRLWKRYLFGNLEFIKIVGQQWLKWPTASTAASQNNTIRNEIEF